MTHYTSVLSHKCLALVLSSVIPRLDRGIQLFQRLLEGSESFFNHLISKDRFPTRFACVNDNHEALLSYVLVTDHSSYDYNFRLIVKVSG